MTRLEQHRQKDFQKKVTIMIAALVVLLVIFATVGLKLIINATLFLGNLGAKKETPTVQKNDFFGSLDIDSIPTATNSAKFIVTGSTTNYDKLEFYINDTKVKSTEIQPSNNFQEEIGDLTKGENKVYVKALSSDTKNQKQSITYTVVYKSDKPKLDISSPQDNSTVNKQDLSINGSTDKDTLIKVNDSPIVVDANGSFQTTISLKEGDNKITIIAQDDAGNQSEKDLTVKYQKDE